MAEKVVIGNAELWHGDCREVLPLLPAHDLLCTDPPYGIGQDGGAQRTRGSKRTNGDKLGWDNERPPAWLFGLMTEKAPAAVICGGNYFADLLPASMGWLYWEKRMGGDFADGELAWTSMHRALRQFSYYKKNPGDEHPTQKPVELMRWCVSFAPDAMTVLDPFMGSGTTAAVALRHGRRYVGCELNPEYLPLQQSRMKEMAMPLFDAAQTIHER